LTDAQSRPSLSAVLGNRNFLMLWLAQALSQTAQNAIWFGLMVVVEEQTQSTTHMSIVVLTSVIPSVLLGIIAGVFVDRMNKKSVLIATNALRAVAVIAFLFYGSALWVVYLVNFVFCCISQFFAPAEAALIPQLVPRRQLITANSFFNVTLTLSQLVGLVILGPPIVKLFGAQTLFISISVVFAICTILVSFLPKGETPKNSVSSLESDKLVNQLWVEVKEGWDFITADRTTSSAMVNLATMSCLMLVMATLAPRYVVAVLGIPADNSVFVLAPAGLGVLLGTTLLPRLTHRFHKRSLMNTGVTVMGIGLFLMGMLDTISHLVPTALSSAIGLAQQPAAVGLIPALLLLAIVFGLQYSFVTIPAQTLLMERAPVSTRGRVFAVQIMLGNVASIFPLLFVGGLSDVFGIRLVIALVGMVTFVFGLMSVRRARAGVSASVNSHSSKSQPSSSP
jgi:MFS family permease